MKIRSLGLTAFVCLAFGAFGQGWSTDTTAGTTTTTDKVGIGTASPGTKLDVQGTGGETIDVFVKGRIRTGDSTNAGGIWLNSAQTLFLGQRGASDIGFYTSPNGWRFTVQGATGYVGIGPNDPQNLLDVRASGPRFLSLGTPDASSYLLLYNGGAGDHEAILWTSGQHLRFATTTAITPGGSTSEKMRITDSGKIAIGGWANVGSSAPPVNLVDIRGTSAQFLSIANDTGTKYVVLYNGGANDNEAIAWTPSTALRFGTSTLGGGSFAELMRINGNGDVNIGGDVAGYTAKLEVTGDIRATGKISAPNVVATYQDLAEWVPATDDLAPGTVVVLNREAENEVMAATRPYDTAVAGVVSAQPGIILGEEGAKKEQIATAGRVKVRVDATKRPIRVGDLLVTSAKSGVAMVSEPVVINGIEMHRPGTVIGKALQPLASGEGEILVLLSLQ